MASPSTSVRDVQSSRRRLLKIITLASFSYTSLTGASGVATAQNEIPQDFSPPLVHEEVWTPNRPNFSNTPRSEQSWTPNRPNFSNTPIHTEMWGKDADVKLNNVTIKPQTVSDSDEIHELSFEISNLSADGGEDDFTISLPNSVDVNNATITEADGLSPVPADPVPENEIEFTVDPTSSVQNPVNMTVELELSPSNG